MGFDQFIRGKLKSPSNIIFGNGAGIVNIYCSARLITSIKSDKILRDTIKKYAEYFLITGMRYTIQLAMFMFSSNLDRLQNARGCAHRHGGSHGSGTDFDK